MNPDLTRDAVNLPGSPMGFPITFLLVRKLLGLVGMGPSPDEKDV
jgi:hypothetical protein